MKLTYTQAMLLPVLLTSIIITVISISFGALIAYYQTIMLGLYAALGLGVSGFLIVILPQILFLRKLLKDDEEPNQTGVVK